MQRLWAKTRVVLHGLWWTSHRLAWALVLGGLAALWVWSGTSRSLAQALTLGRWLVPSLQALHWQDMNASVRHGGSITDLRWQDKAGTKLHIANTQLAWDWRSGVWISVALRDVQLDTPPSSPKAAAAPQAPTDLRLPIAVPIHVELHLRQARVNQLTVAELHTDYRYDLRTAASDAPSHRLNIHDLHLAQGRYTLDAHIAAVAPLRLQAQWQGQIEGLALPLSPHAQARTWQAQLQGKAEGTLATTAARIALTTDLTGHASASAPHAHVTAELHPWQVQPVAMLDAEWQALDANAFVPTLPVTQLSGKAQATPQGTDEWDIRLQLDNAISGAWDAQRLPLQHLTLVARAQNKTDLQSLILHELRAQLAQGRIEGQGRWLRPLPAADARRAPDQWQGQITAQALRSNGLWQAWPASIVDATLSAYSSEGTTEATRITVELKTQADSSAPYIKKQSVPDLEILRQLQISSQAEWSGSVLTLHRLQAQVAGAALHTQGRIDTHDLGFAGQFELKAPGLNAHWDGTLHANKGEGKTRVQIDDAHTLSTWAARLPSLPPDISRQMPAFTSGQVLASATWQGGWQAPRWQTEAQITQLHAPATPTLAAWHVAKAQVQAKDDGERASGQLEVDAVWDQWRAQGNWNAEATRDKTNATSSPATNWRIALAPWTLHLSPAAEGKGKKDASTASAPLRIHAPQTQVLHWPITTAATAPAPRWQIEAGQLDLAGAELSPLRLRWNPLQGHLQGGFEGSGEFSGLHLAQVRQWLRLAPTPPTLPPELAGDLHLQGQWRVQLPERSSAADTPQTPHLELKVQRQSGDILLHHGDTPQALGMKELLLHIHTPSPKTWQVRLQADSTQAGTLDAQLSTRTTTDWPDTSSPLQGHVKAHVPKLDQWAMLAPPGWRLGGQLSADVQLQGRLDRVDWQGQLRGQGLALRSVVDGLAYQNGEFTAQFNGQRLNIQEGRIDGEGGAAQGGTLHFKGHAAWPTAATASDASTSAVLEAKADKLKVSARADRRLTLSGQVQTTWAAKALQVRGHLQADQALFILPEDTAPTQGSDVVVRPSRQTTQAASAPPTPPTSTPADVAVQIDLGPQFEVKGQGLNTRLSGQLAVNSVAAGRGFQVRGEVKTVGGSYRAYGQNLRIAQGVVRFSGPYDDPALNILALRGSAAPTRSQNDTGEALNSSGSAQQQVGVQITGSARAPRLQLYALPDMPDSEKLAWLVLGRPASGAGAEAAAIQQAALALLGSRAQDSQGGLVSALGLDELSLGSAQNGNSGSSTAALTVGKRISDRVYLAYEQSLGGAMGALSLFYDLSHRLTLRAQTGQHNAIDLVYTRTHE